MKDNLEFELFGVKLILPKQSAREAWQKTKRVIDIYFMGKETRK